MSRYDWGYDRYRGYRPYDRSFASYPGGHYGGPSNYWGPGLGGSLAGGRYDRGFPRRPYDAPYRRPRGYDRQGGFAGRMLAQGWGYPSEHYVDEGGRGRYDGWHRRYDRGW